MKQLADRFPGLSALEDLGVFEEGAPFDPVGCNAALRRLGHFFKADESSYVLQIERLLRAFSFGPNQLGGIS